MLVCNVSLRPRRSAIAAQIAEVVAATDATATGNIVFATLVDDPASVVDRLDAYLGEIMLEAATADTTLDAGLSYNGAIDEAVTAAAVPDATVAGAVVAKQAMVPGVFINSSTSRDANAKGIMINI